MEMIIGLYISIKYAVSAGLEIINWSGGTTSHYRQVHCRRPLVVGVPNIETYCLTT